MSDYRVPKKAFLPNRSTVLVAGGEGYARILMREVLRGIGVNQVLMARSIKEAVSEVIDRRPTALLLDEVMDETTGVEFTRRIRTELSSPHREVPIIIVTSLTRRQDVDVARNAGVDEIIAKPMSTAAVISRLEAVTMNPREFVSFPSYVGPCRRRKPLSPDFQGDLRRLTDPIGGELTQEDAIQQSATSIRKSMAKVQSLLNLTGPGVVLPVRQVYAAAQETYGEALALKDVLLERCTKSLVHYVEANGAAKPLDPEAVGAHVHAIVDLVRTPLVITKEREMVAEGLEKLVTKKLAVKAA